MIKAVLVTLDNEFLDLLKVMDLDVEEAKEIMLDLLANALYYNSAWSPVINPMDLLVDKYHATFEERNALTRSIFMLHQTVESTLHQHDNLRWGIFELTVMVCDAQGFSCIITDIGDYRIAQWEQENADMLSEHGRAVPGSALAERFRCQQECTVARERIRTPAPVPKVMRRSNTWAIVSQGAVKEKQEKDFKETVLKI